MTETHPNPHPDLAGYVLGTSTPEEAQAFAEHLAGCQTCQAELADLATLPRLLADVPPAEPLPPGLEERTFAAIEAAAAGAGLPTVPTPQVVVPIGTARRAGWSTRYRAVTAVAAAVVVVALGLGVLSSLGKTGQAPVATIKLISVSGGPAHGVATVRSTRAGLDIEMTIDGLAPNPPNTFYTCWLVGPGDSLAHQNRVSVGSFVVTSSAEVHVRWTTAADLHRFPHMGVTLEPANGIPLHQGKKILTGG